MSQNDPKTPVDISVLIPTKDSMWTLEPLLASLKQQKNVAWECIIADNFSTDLTSVIARGYPVKFIRKGPERHAQRRHLAAVAQGRVLFFVDSDMVLQPGLLAEVLHVIGQGADAVIIPEEPVGAQNFWTNIKCEERKIYAGCDQVEAARAFTREIYERAGGFSHSMIALEDWDLTARVREKGGRIMRTKTNIFHNEGQVTLRGLMQKKAYYGGQAGGFVAAHGWRTMLGKLYFFRPAFWRAVPGWLGRPRVLFGVIIMFSAELLAGAWGAVSSRTKA